MTSSGLCSRCKRHSLNLRCATIISASPKGPFEPSWPTFQAPPPLAAFSQPCRVSEQLKTHPEGCCKLARRTPALLPPPPPPLAATPPAQHAAVAAPHSRGRQRRHLCCAGGRQLHCQRCGPECGQARRAGTAGEGAQVAGVLSAIPPTVTQLRNEPVGRWQLPPPHPTVPPQDATATPCTQCSGSGFLPCQICMGEPRRSCISRLPVLLSW